MSGHDEHEPVWGLPSAPPPGEEILWQGRPDWKRFAVSALKIRWVALYLGVVVVAKIAFGLNRGEALEGLGQMLALFGLCLGFVAWLAWLHARATVYTITNRRGVMRVGVAINLACNLPFEQLAAADLALRDEDDGDIALRIKPPARVRRFIFWPHLKGGHFLSPRPALKAIREPERVARLLADAVSRWAEANDAIEVTRAAGEPSEAPAEPRPELTSLPRGATS